MFIDMSTYLFYYFALNFYLNFIWLHNFDIEPMQDTLSFYIVYMCAHIKHRSIQTYLSGIYNHSQIWEICNFSLVKNTLIGCLHIKSSQIKHKLPLFQDNLLQIVNSATNPSHHDILLFVSLVLTGFYGLLHLGKLCQPVNDHLKDEKHFFPTSFAGQSMWAGEVMYLIESNIALHLI